jgi:hypothetical protein
MASSLVETFHGQGLLNCSVFFAHASWVTEKEVGLLRTSGGALSCIPEIELSMTHGDPVGRPWCGLYVRHRWGHVHPDVRGSRSSTRPRECRAGQGRKGTPEYRTRIADILRMAILGGGEALHKEKELRSLEVGKKADLLILDADSPATLGAQNDPPRAVVISVGVNYIEMIRVNGEIVLDRARKGGPFTCVDWAGEEAKKIKKAMAQMRQKYEDLRDNCAWRRRVPRCELCSNYRPNRHVSFVCFMYLKHVWTLYPSLFWKTRSPVKKSCASTTNAYQKGSVIHDRRSSCGCPWPLYFHIKKPIPESLCICAQRDLTTTPVFIYPSTAQASTWY